jgi:hypothetical protein
MEKRIKEFVVNKYLKKCMEDAIVLIQDDDYWNSLYEKLTYEEFLEWIKPTNFNEKRIDIKGVPF